MKMIVIVALALVAAVTAAPAETSEIAKVLRSDNVLEPGVGYHNSFESDDGIQKQEEGVVKTVLDEDKKEVKVVSVRGSYSYPGEDGKRIEVTYEADENGFRAFGDSIPKEPSAAAVVRR